MNELTKITALMADTDALAMRVARANAEGLLSGPRAAAMLDKLADVAGGFQGMLNVARARCLNNTEVQP